MRCHDNIILVMLFSNIYDIFWHIFRKIPLILFLNDNPTPFSLHTILRATGSEKLQQVKVSEAHKGSNARNYSKVRELHKAIFELLQNPTLFFLNLAGASEGLIIAGFAAFLPKQIENQFSVTAIVSALIMGLITVPAGGGGMEILLVS